MKLTNVETDRMIALSEFQDRWNRMEKRSCVPAFKKVPKDYVFDEEKSVKWNKEQVEKHNTNYDEAVKRLNTQKNKERDAILEDIYSFIQNEIGHNLSKEKAVAVFNFVKTYSDNEKQRISMLLEAISLIDKVMTPERPIRRKSSVINEKSISVPEEAANEMESDYNEER